MSRLSAIAERIISGEQVCNGEIRAHNARAVLDRYRYMVANAHEKCRDKNCTHQPVEADLDFAAQLANEVHEVCTCGNTHD